MALLSVTSGQVSSGITLNVGDQLLVQSGGIALQNLIIAGSLEFVLSGGSAAGEIVSGGEYVSGGGVAIGVVIDRGGYQVVYAGAVASGSVVNSLGALDAWGSVSGDVIGNGGSIDLFSGGMAVGGRVDQAGSQFVFAGGSAASTYLAYGAADYVSSGGVADHSVVAGGAYEVIYNGAVGIGTSVGNGGVDDIYSGGVVSQAVVEAGGAQLLYAGASAVITQVASHGLAFVFSGGVMTDTQLQSGGLLVLLPGAVANGLVQAAGGEVISTGVLRTTGDFTVVSYGVAVQSNIVLDGGDQQFVLPAGEVSGGVVSGGGTQHVYAGGSVGAMFLASGGFQFVSSGGLASGNHVSGGTQYVSSGGVVEASVLENTGVLLVAVGGSAVGTLIQSGGNDYVYSAGLAGGSLVGLGGAEYVLLSGVASGAVVGSGGDEFVYSGGTVLDAGIAAGGLLWLGAGGVASATSVASGGEIDVSYLAYVGSGSAGIDAGGVLQVSEGNTTVSLSVSGDPGGEYFHLAADGSGGTLVSANSTPCFCRGTRIRTQGGERAVEDLRIGDEVMSCRGVSRPILWIGRRSFAGRFVAGNLDALPVVIHAGALADQVPQADLMLSPLHALWLDGVLIPVRALVNGGSIRQFHAVKEVEYFHIEMESHDVIWAEGAPAETFLDDRSRSMFHNAPEFAELYPQWENRPNDGYYAPRMENGPFVDAVRERLAARGRQLGWGVPAVMRARLEPGTVSLLVPPGVGTVELRSAFGRAAGDARWLGALVRGISLDGVRLDLNDNRLGRGFYPLEAQAAGDVRWTDGEALLLLDPVDEPQWCDIDVAAVTVQSVSKTFEVVLRCAGRLRVDLPAGVGKVCLVARVGYVERDTRELGALVTEFMIDGEALDLAGAEFAAGFHPPEQHGPRMVRWTDGCGEVTLVPRPVARVCEIAVSRVMEEEMRDWNAVAVGMSERTG